MERRRVMTRRMKWLLWIYLVFTVVLAAMLRWGPDSYQCAGAVFFAPHKADVICARAYPDWGQGGEGDDGVDD